MKKTLESLFLIMVTRTKDVQIIRLGLSLKTEITSPLDSSLHANIRITTRLVDQTTRRARMPDTTQVIIEIITNVESAIISITLTLLRGSTAVMTLDRAGII
ncbi:MAG: hypothetical protein COA74_05720 [Gammaproteobacteria bacterium]|nr:MAG: hypothetical protein COA74_05720 [Gammaproteobacteria bacterium]